MPDENEMITREEPRFVQFNPGEIVEGVLIGIKRVAIDGRFACKYTIDDGGVLYSFLGTYQINEKIRPSDMGHKIIVRYEGEDTAVGRNGNKMRHFGVQVSKNVVDKAAAHGNELGITDDDIPF
jgi:hypothetical protein